MGYIQPDDARVVAESLLGDTPRWQHVLAVAKLAKHIGEKLDLDPEDLRVLLSAAWLHDIGHASKLWATGFHAIDGAYWLRRQIGDSRVSMLVAHHSFAAIEAAERGFADHIEKFPREVSIVSDVLAFSDMSCGPNGEKFDIKIRLDEIKKRYLSANEAAGKFIDRIEPGILQSCDRIAAMKR